MYVHQWMTRDPITTRPEARVMGVLDQMRQKEVRRMPVVQDDRLVGIITRTDIQAAVGPIQRLGQELREVTLRVEDVMTSPPMTVELTETMEQATTMMYRERISGLPVLDEGKLVGIITETDLFHALVRVFGFAERGARVRFELDSTEGLLEEIQKRTVGLVIRNLVVFRDELSGKFVVQMKLRGPEAK